MKEKFSKLLLGEDMSGGGKGVCTAVTISNAITNLYGTIRNIYSPTFLKIHSYIFFYNKSRKLLSCSFGVWPASETGASASSEKVDVEERNELPSISMRLYRRIHSYVTEFKRRDYFGGEGSFNAVL